MPVIVCRLLAVLAVCALCVSGSGAQNFSLDLSLTARTVDQATGLKTDIQTGGVVPAGTYEVEIRYRISDLATDNEGSRGLSSSLIRLSFTGDQGFTLARAPLTNYQVDPLSFGPPGNPALNPDNTGLAQGTLTGLIGAFRGGLMSDDLPGNGVLNMSGFTVLPLTISAPGQQSWGASGSPTPANTNSNPTTWPLYAFRITVASGNAVVIRARAETDPTSGNRFGYFQRVGTQTNPVPQTSTLSTDATLTIGTVSPRACCLPSGACTSATASDCTAQGGDVGPVGSTCATTTFCCVSPAIVTQPVPQNAPVGGNVSFAASVSGTGPLTYQWLKDSSPLVDGPRISGATTPNLTIASLLTTDTADYQLSVSNSCNVQVLSVAARLNVSQCGFASGMITGATALQQGQALRLTATVTAGNPPFSFQWRRNGQFIVNDCRFVGTATSMLVLNNSTPTDSGLYDVVISNSCGPGSVVTPVSVVVSPCGPAIALQPVTQTPLIGRPVSLSVVVAGNSAGVQYQWRVDGVPLTDGGRYAGVRTSLLTINYVGPFDAGAYDCVLSNTCGNTISQPAAVAPRPCTADANRNGSVTVQDVFTFVEAYLNQQCP